MSPAPQPQSSDGGSGLPRLFIYADGTCRSAAELMATEEVVSLPVVDRASRQVSGTLTLQHLLKGRSKAVVRENEQLRLALSAKSK